MTALYLEKAVSTLDLMVYPELAPHRLFPSRARPRMLRLRSLDAGDLGLIRAFFLGGIKTRGDFPSRLRIPAFSITDSARSRSPVPTDVDHRSAATLSF